LKKASKSVSRLTVVVSPDPLSPIPSIYLLGMKTLDPKSPGSSAFW